MKNATSTATQVSLTNERGRLQELNRLMQAEAEERKRVEEADLESGLRAFRARGSFGNGELRAFFCLPKRNPLVVTSRFYSEPGVGTVFKVYLPRVEAAERIEKPGSEIKIFHGSETILVVEDEDIVRGLTRRILVEAGYNVVRHDVLDRNAVVN